MLSSPLVVALLNLALLAVLGALVWLIAWSILGDRRRQVPLCPRCRHDMRGIEGLRCPECGMTVRSASELLRRRRRWGLATLSLLTLLAIAFAIRAFWSQTSWTTAVPTSIVLRITPWLGTGALPADLLDELGDRVARSELSDQEISELLDRIMAGDRGAEFGSAAWVRKYGPLVDRWVNVGRRGFLQAAPTAERTAIVDAFDRRIEALPPIVSCDFPPNWIATEPLPLELLIERRWNTGSPLRITVESLTIAGAQYRLLPPVDAPIDIARGRPVVARVPLLFEAPTATDGAVDGALRVRIDRRADPAGDGAADATGELHGAGDGDAGADRPLPASTTVTIPLVGLRVGDDADAPFTGAHGEEADAAIAEFLRPGLIRWARGSRRFAMRVDPSPEMRARLGELAIGIEAEILEDGVPRRRLRLWWPGRGPVRFEPPVEDPVALERAKDDDPRWSIRVRGMRDLARRAALMDRQAAPTKWWDGEVTIPLRVTDDAGESFPRAWVVPARALDATRDAPRAP